MKAPKIVFIGAGSMSFGTATFRDIFSAKLLKGAQLWLVDIDPENLARMFALAKKFNELTGMEIDLHATEDRREALPGANFVISSIAIERCELWKQDFNVPIKHGIRHCLGENGGAGALYFTMRTLPLVIKICRDMEELCPDAWFLNFSNPESRLVLGVNKFTNIKCVGFCHGIYMGRYDVATILGRDEHSIEVSAGGMNHFQWITDIRDAETGEDLYPAFREAEKTYDPTFRPFTRKMYRAFGLWPTCSDDHLGEYMAYGYEAGEHGYNFDADAADRVNQKARIDAVISGEQDLGDWARPSGEHAVDAIVAIHFNLRRNLPACIVYNNGAIPQLPDDVAVEVPVVIDGSGVHRTIVDNLPDGVIGLMNQQVSPQRLSVLAAVKGSKEIALQALLCDPTINSTAAAVAINDELFEINKAYIEAVI